MNHDIAFELARQKTAHIILRAQLIESLGRIPEPQPILPLRRHVVALPATVELRHAR